jgi:hypothetical protein
MAKGNVKHDYLRSLRAPIEFKERPVSSSQGFNSTGTFRRSFDDGFGDVGYGPMTSSRAFEQRQLKEKLSTQKIQELPLEFARFSNTHTVYKHVDKNKYTLGFSRLPVRSHWFDRDSNHCATCHIPEN